MKNRAVRWAIIAVVVIAVAIALGALGLHSLSQIKSDMHPNETSTSGESSPQPSVGALRKAHTVKTFDEDMRFKDGQCRLVVKSEVAGYYLPDPNCTPGAIDTAVTQANINDTICRAGYTKTVRPGTHITNPQMDKSYRAYGMSETQHPKRTTEYDHLISLQLGGASTTSNLFPEPNKRNARGKVNPKDAVENSLNSLVCAKAIPLAAAQEAIRTDWTTALTRLGFHAKVIDGKSRLCSDTKCYPKKRPTSDND